jgi:hypothetical protein
VADPILAIRDRAREVTDRARRQQLWVWILPLAVVVLIRQLHGNHLQTLAGGLIVVLIVAAAAQSPARSLIVLLALLPFQTIILAALFRLGVPAAIVRGLGGWKEALGLGVFLAGARAFLSSDEHLDTLDKLAIGYLIAVAAYLVLPQIFVHRPTGAPGIPFNVRALAFRADAAFVLLFLGARHAPMGADVRRRLVRVLILTGLLIAAITVFEFLFSSAWNRFLVETVHVPDYKAQILHVFSADPKDLRYHSNLAGRDIVRAGSVLLSPLTLGFYLIVPLALAMESITRRSGPRATLAYLTVVLGGAALLFTVTRSAIVAALVAALALLRPTPGRTRAARVRFALILSAGLFLFLPLASATGLTARASSTFQGDESSTTDHIKSFQHGIATLVSHPLGNGLGTAPGIGDRFNGLNKVTSENAYIQVGNEIGIQTLILFVVLLIALRRRLRRVAGEDPDILSGATAAIALGLLVGGLFLHIWLDVSLAWTFWGLAGVVLGVADRSGEEAATAPDAVAL